MVIYVIQLIIIDKIISCEKIKVKNIEEFFYSLYKKSVLC